MNSYGVESPLIEEVMEMTSGAVMSAAEVIGNEYDDALKLRTALSVSIAEGRPKYCCSLCGVAVRLNCMQFRRRFYFKHIVDDGRCPIDTRGMLSQKAIDAIRYNGQKESARHIQMKEWLRRSLHSDPDFQDVEVEGRWTHKITGEYRTPDVSALYRGMKIVFEIQLSSTYLNVIAERKAFYLREGALLFWIFAEFDDGMRKLTQDDIFYNNNQNAFVVNVESLRLSELGKRFNLECIWREPISSTEVTGLIHRTLEFNQLALNVVTQQVYYFDYYGALEAIKLHEAEAVQQLILERERSAASNLALKRKSARKYFQYCWSEFQSKSVEYESCWENLQERFDELNEDLPEHAHDLPHEVFNIIFSIREGNPVGWDYKSLIEVIHRILPGENRTRISPYLPWYWKAIKEHKRTELIKNQDVSGRWAKKVAAHRKALKQGAAPAKTADSSVLGLLSFLFPELSHKLSGTGMGSGHARQHT